MTIYLVTNLTSAAPGRVNVESDGRVSVDYYSDFTDAQSFTSLDGVTYAVR